MKIVRTRRYRLILPVLFAVLTPHGGSSAGHAATGPSQEEGTSIQAQQVLEKVRPGMIKIETLPIGSDSPYANGSGFAVGPGDLIITNYHVVSKVIMEPERYRLEFVLQDGSKGALSVVAIDVVNDLAAVRGDTGPLAVLTFDTRIPEKGTRGFSIGFPEDQGLTVTEGIVNGLSEDSVRGAIHFTGPVNSGMSGGPALTEGMKVFGVNASVLLDSQLVSLLVPAAAAVALIESRQGVRLPSAAALFEELGNQLRQYSSSSLGLWPAAALPAQQFGRFRAPGKPGEFARCWSEDDEDPQKLYRTAEYGCSSKDTTCVDDGLCLGSWTFIHRLIQAPEFGALRFASLLESQFEPENDDSQESRLHNTRWSCQDGVVALPSGRVKSVLCVRGYTRFEGFYDINLKIATLDRPGESLLSQLSISGCGFPESIALARRFLEERSWTP